MRGLDRDEPAARSLRRIVRRAIENALRISARGALSDESIHAARKELKKARATLRLLRKALGRSVYASENAAPRADRAPPHRAARPRRSPARAGRAGLTPRALRFAGRVRVRKSPDSAQCRERVSSPFERVPPRETALMTSDTERLRRELQKIVAELEAFLSEAAGKSGGRVEGAAAVLREALEAAQRRLTGLEEDLRERASETLRMAKESVRENPWGALAVAAVAAFFLGVALARRPSEPN
jgi:ElaB/YqjD/DUF883 family membrane-anchored ribosome-binding protein